MTDISMDREYRTREGLDVEIYAIGRGGSHPVHGALKDPDDGWYPVSWTKDGTFSPGAVPHLYDIFEVKPKLTGWVNVYSDAHNKAGFRTGHAVFASKQEARGAANSGDYITTLFLEIDPSDAE